jgi:hypothetical protein
MFFMTEGSVPHTGNNAAVTGAVIQPMTTESDPPNIVGLAPKRYDKILPPHALERAVDALRQAMLTMAELKNVPLETEYSEGLAKATAASLAPEILRGILDGDAAAVSFVVRSINGLLDTIAATRVLNFMWKLEGFDQIESQCLTRQAGQWINVLVANDTTDARYRWPDTNEMATQYYRTRGSGPVHIRGAEGQPARARYFIDIEACRAPAKSANRSSMLLPLLMHCPGLPGTTNAMLPDGRCTRKSDDGTGCTSYWKNGLLHRNETEGAAYVERNESAGIITEEFWVHGEMQVSRTTDIPEGLHPHA